jgi:hypothetical protein
MPNIPLYPPRKQQAFFGADEIGRRCCAVLKVGRSSLLRLENETSIFVRLVALWPRIAIVKLRPAQLEGVSDRVVLGRREHALDWESDYHGFLRLGWRRYEVGLRLAANGTEGRLFLRPLHLYQEQEELVR